MDTAAFEARLVASAARVRERLQQELERSGGIRADKDTLYRLGFSPGNGQLGPGGTAHPKARLKFLTDARSYIRADAQKLPHFAGISKAFEIGVGTGYLFAMLEELMGIEMSGIDVDFDRDSVFREMRKELGISDRVFEHRVRARRPIPVPRGTEAVVCFRPMFDEGWKVADHEYFLADCARQLSGKRLVIFCFNPRYLNADPAVAELYRSRGTRPIPGNDIFVVVAV